MFLYRKRWLFIVFAILLIWVTGYDLMKLINWTRVAGKPVSVALVQGNIPQEVKWSPDHIRPTLKKYYQLTNTEWDHKLIIWPEAAIPVFKYQIPEFIHDLNEKANQQNVALISGLLTRDKNNQFRYYNALMVFGKGHGTYYKRHLVPFGEYVPFGQYIRGFMNFLNLPMSNLSPGPSKQPDIIADGINIAPFICYEIAYSSLVRQDMPQAQLLLTISNDAWFGDSFAPAQHAEIAQMRALQTGRYLLFVANTGITAIIDPKGQIEKAAPQFKTTVLNGKVYPMKGETPWIWLGNTPIIIAMFLLLVPCLFL